MINRRLPFVIFAIIFLSLPGTGDLYAFQFGGTDIRLRAGAKEGYDDNITYVKSNKKGGFTSIFSSGLYALYENARRFLEASGNVNYQLYNGHTEFNNFNEDFSLDYREELSKRNRLSVRDNLIHAYEPQNFQQAFGAQGGWYSYFRNIVDLVFTRDMSKRLTADVRYSNHVDVFSRSDQSNAYLNKGGLGFDYSLFPRSRFLFTYDFACRSFTPGRSAWIHTVLGGFRQELNQKVSVQLQAGADFVHSFMSSDYVRPHYAASVSYLLDRKTRINVYFVREHTTTAYLPNIFDIWQVAAGFDRELSKKIVASLAAFYGHGKYLLADITDNFIGARGKVTYKIMKHLALEMTYKFEMVDSNSALQEYVKNDGYLGLGLEF